MRAVTVSEYGGIPVVGEIPTPEPGAGQVLLRMRAAGMNPMDGTLASGAWRPATASVAYPWQKSAAPHPHEYRAAVRRHVRDRLAVKNHAPGQSGHRAPGTAPTS